MPSITEFVSPLDSALYTLSFLTNDLSDVGQWSIQSDDSLEDDMFSDPSSSRADPSIYDEKKRLKYASPNPSTYIPNFHNAKSGWNIHGKELGYMTNMGGVPVPVGLDVHGHVYVSIWSRLGPQS